MDLTDYEIKGRAVAQHFYTELEKIAYSKRVKALYQAAGKAQKQVDTAADTLGWQRHIPFTRAHRAYHGHVGVPGSGVKGRARELANQAEGQAARERQALLSALESGRGNQEDILRRLKEGPQQVGAVHTPARQAARAIGVGGQVEQPAFGAGGRAMSPLARKAMLVGGAGVAGAGALYAGQQYLNQQQGYGGY
jgi:hypothetical protein